MSKNENDRKLLFDDLSFAGEEAYKMLRTNLAFSFTDSKKCKVIGVTSSVRNEGKSTTSINLAYSISKADKKVLLIDGDMRLPTVAKRLKIKNALGLSNVLIGETYLTDTMLKLKQSESMYVITSGGLPPNPSELLGSDQMKKIINKLEENFDYIIIDLPPINIVSDPLIISKLIDGYLFVVRQEQSYRQDVFEAMRKFSLVDANLLGFVLTNVESSKKYYKYKGKYGYRYGYRYGYGYDQGNKKNKKKNADEDQA